MSDTEVTTFENRAKILAELWIKHRKDEVFQEFIEFSDLGLPLAYAIANDIVKSTPESQRFVDEVWILLMLSLQVDDTGFETLAGVFDAQIDGQDE